MPDQKAEKEFEITTTAQVERTYVVKGGDDDQAHTRLRSYLKDADALREGVVVEQEDKRKDTTPQRINGSKPIVGKPPTPLGGGKTDKTDPTK